MYIISWGRTTGATEPNRSRRPAPSECEIARETAASNSTAVCAEMMPLFHDITSTSSPFSRTRRRMASIRSGQWRGITVASE